MGDLQRLDRARIEELRGIRGWNGQGDGLWLRGSAEGLRAPCVSIVGTRAATAYGRGIARQLARDLCKAGCTIVSGLALGIDAAAHEGALDANGTTIGVLGGGHDQFFPRRNAELAQRMIAAGGAVLSPFPPSMPTVPHQFLVRNGIVAALSDACVVVEAPARSGALNTAQWAAASIPVLVVPADVDRASFAGSHALIRDGATLARDAGDVLEALALDRLPLRVESRAEPSEPVQRALIRALGSGELDLDSLVTASGCTPAETFAALAVLELDGLVERRSALRFALV